MTFWKLYPHMCIASQFLSIINNWLYSQPIRPTCLLSVLNEYHAISLIPAFQRRPSFLWVSVEFNRYDRYIGCRTRKCEFTNVSDPHIIWNLFRLCCFTVTFESTTVFFLFLISLFLFVDMKPRDRAFRRQLIAVSETQIYFIGIVLSETSLLHAFHPWQVQEMLQLPGVSLMTVVPNRIRICGRCASERKPRKVAASCQPPESEGMYVSDAFCTFEV